MSARCAPPLHTLQSFGWADARRQTYQIAAQAGYPMVTLPAGTNDATGMPFGLGLMHSAWQEPELVRWASAIEDLQRHSTGTGRTLPQWHEYQAKNIPVLNL